MKTLDITSKMIKSAELTANASQHFEIALKKLAEMRERQK